MRATAIAQHRRRLYQLAAFFWLFQRGMAPLDELVEEAEAGEEKDESAYQGIRCPACAWRPAADDVWCCVSSGHPEYFYGGCGTEWNTFDTRGVCPGCGHQWRYTACLRCYAWSPHEAWYVDERD